MDLRNDHYRMIQTHERSQTTVNNYIRNISNNKINNVFYKCNGLDKQVVEYAEVSTTD